jgi:hypothetical protein
LVNTYSTPFSFSSLSETNYIYVTLHNTVTQISDI